MRSHRIKSQGQAPTESEEGSGAGPHRRHKTVRVTRRQYVDYEQLADPETFQILLRSLRIEGYGHCRIVSCTDRPYTICGEGRPTILTARLH